jgi:cation:H+ antiporter
MAFVWILLGLLLLVFGAEIMVRGAAGLARAAGLSSLIIGLTVVSFGTSAPELAVGVKAALAGQGDIALGNVIGSNTFNILFILGLSSIMLPLVVSSQLIRLDVPIMIGVSILVMLLAGDGDISRLEGVLLFSMLLFYTCMLVILGRRETAGNPSENSQAASAAENDAGSEAGSEAADQRAADRSIKQLGISLLLMLAGLGLLVLGSGWLVDGASTLARAWGVSELVIGLTIIAVGTSMPEVATSVVASVRGQRDIAVGNVGGSNLFNLLGVLGATAIFSSDGIIVDRFVMNFDLPIMAAVALACLPIFLTAGRISRWEGGVFLGYYMAYITFTILALSGHPGLHTFTVAMIWFVIPLSILGLAVSFIAWLHKR